VTKPRYLHCLISVVAVMTAPTALADGGLAGFLRGVTGALGSQNPSSQTPPPTAVMGIRGIDDVEAAPAAAGTGLNKDMELIKGWSASQAEVEKAAKAKRLVARNVTLASASAGAKP
jgi:hypothetical protein